jgi:transposase InsO family protein
MPWKEVTAVNERMEFVARLKAGERMSDLCREFGISRKTGYKFEQRYEEHGPKGLYDVSRRPRRLARQISPGIQTAILELKRDKPTWGAAKIHEVLGRQHPQMELPVRSTIHDLLDRYGLVKKRAKRRRYHAYPTLREQNIEAPNQLWCADFKGQFRMGNARYCYPLTVTDFHSRYLLGCEAMESTKSESTQQGFEWIFREYGLPTRIRTDNGSPFSSRSVQGLSSLSVWWMRLGIQLERIEPGQPQQNGRHERMHRTLKEEILPRSAKNLLVQQEQLDRFREDFNERRPHEALKMKCPADVYKPSLKRYPDKLPEPVYSHHDLVRVVQASGSVHFRGQNNVFISYALVDQTIGFEEEQDGIWRINFMDLDLGFLDEETMKFSPIAPEDSDHRLRKRDRGHSLKLGNKNA